MDSNGSRIVDMMIAEREFTVGNSRIRLVEGDITEMGTEAIVNAANSSLMGGGGVDGAIHRKGGPRILEECKRFRAEQWPEGLPAGEAVITSGGNLKARHVIHTVGPVWRGGDHGEAEQLKKTYLNSMKLAVSKGLKTMAFPSISTGAYGYPVKEASCVAIRTVMKFLKTEDKLEEVTFVLFSGVDFQIYLRTAERKML